MKNTIKLSWAAQKHNTFISNKKKKNIDKTRLKVGEHETSTFWNKIEGGGGKIYLFKNDSQAKF